MDKDIKLLMASLILFGITAILVIISTILTAIGVITPESIIWTITIIPSIIGCIIAIYDMIYMIINNAREKDKR